MARGKPPISTLTWSMREVLEPGTPATAVTCALGRIMVAGERIFRIMPGTWDVQMRGLPEGLELPLSIAMEPRPPFRIAIGPESGDAVIFTDTSNATSITGHAFTETPGSKQARQLAWVVNEGQSSLFARTDDGLLYRMQAEGWEVPQLPPVHAIAHDEQGGFGALTVVDGVPKVFLTYDGGATWQIRPLGVEVEAAPDAPAFLALAGAAVAVVVGDSGPLVSRGPDQVTTRYPALSRAFALAFHGFDEDAWIYAALRRTEAEAAAVWLLDAAGGSLKVMEFLADDHEPLEVGPIAWDSARTALMVASRGGLVAMAPEMPKPKRASRAGKPKKPVLQ